jgi:DHA2 family multidrug resistance protein
MSADPAAGRSAVNPWLLAAAVVVPTFMEVLDTTIANVALRYIAGGLSAAETDSEWVITSYLAANAIILPMSGWLSARFGRRNYFLASVAIFTLASALCGLAGSLEQLVLFRVLQGLAGGGLQPGTQGVLIDTFPPEKQGQAMTVFGFAALIAPVIGPTLGGWLTDNYSWRWVFLINVPVGGLALAAAWFLVTDPPYLVAERERMRRGRAGFDFPGLVLLVAVMVSWEVLLSKGQEWDWFGDPFWRVQGLAGVFAVSLGLLIWRELTAAAPLVNLRPLGERNFAAACLICFCAYGVLYGQTTSLPGMLQSLFGYDATTSGLVLSPAGIFAVVLMPVVGAILGRGVDARWLVAVGLAAMAAGNYWLANLNLEVSPWQVVWPRVVVIAGLSCLFAPLNVAAYKYTPAALRGAAVGVFSLLRNEGGSVGTSLAQTLKERRDQFHSLRLGENLDPLNPAVADWLAGLRPYFYQQTGDPAAADRMALQVLDNVRQAQASSLAYFDVFWVFAVLAVLLVPLVLLMRRSAAEPGEHVGAE